MDQIYDNRYYSAGSREPSSRRARTAQLGGSDYAGVDCRAQRPASASHPRAQMNTSTGRSPHSTHAQRPSAQTREKSTRPSSRLSGSDFMHYANDNAVVKAIYDFTHGPQRGLFIGIVVVLVLVSLYFPVRDLYVAKRSNDILAKQVEIRQQYNDELQKSVDKLLSEQGIKDAASEDLGLVMPGEKRIEVQGLDDDSDSSSSKKSSNAKKASEVAKEIEEVGKDAPWYIQTLDMLFGFNGVEGQTVVSNGE
jgi:cell division protein FtsL